MICSLELLALATRAKTNKSNPHREKSRPTPRRDPGAPRFELREKQKHSQTKAPLAALWRAHAIDAAAAGSALEDAFLRQPSQRQPHHGPDQ